MNCSKKNSSSQKKTVGSNNQKGIKRSKSSEHLVPQKKQRKPLKEKESSDSLLTHSLAKSKSTKSVKTKPKSLNKS